MANPRTKIETTRVVVVLVRSKEVGSRETAGANIEDEMVLWDSESVCCLPGEDKVKKIFPRKTYVARLMIETNPKFCHLTDERQFIGF